jgi:hypothetical protein
MNAPRVRGALWSSMAIVLVACGGTSSSAPSTPTASALAIVSGNGQTGFVGVTLSQPLVVRVTSNTNASLAGAVVTFQVTKGSATVSPATASTDANGRAQTIVTLGSTPGSVEVTATVQGTGLTQTFVITAGSASGTTIACQSMNPTTVTNGQVLSGIAGTGICIAGVSASADYALIPFNASNADSAISATDVTGRGISPLVAAALASRSGGPIEPDLQAQLDARLRATARRVLTPLMPAARAWQRQSAAASALRSAIPSSLSIGQLIALNTNADDPCANPKMRTGRVVAISNNAIVVADTGNPLPTFTTAQFQSIATTFDTLVNPLDMQAFGQPSDIDKNGKILIFYTRAVNELTPRGSTTYVGGFFYERDLFPTTDSSSPALEGCPTSNVGEMFYMLAPDTNGVVSVKKGPGEVFNITVGTIAHEYQHLINAARRLYVNNADFEVVWLNEGLSHIAEELLFYRVAGLAPRQNVNSATIRRNQATVDAFNNFQNANIGRFGDFLTKAARSSPYANDDSLNTRGATWSLLRYLADHRGSSDADTWQLLVNSKTEGLPNMTNVFGSTLMTQIRDWSTSIFTDDNAGLSDSRFQMPSWNVRSIYADGFHTTFPLQITPLSDGVKATLNLRGGGEAYLRFTVPAGGQASIDWQANGGAPVSPLISWALVRTR